MGTTMSKATDNVKDDLAESNLPSAPILTPQTRRLDWDPRSPSTDIARTPIEVLKTPITTNTGTPADNILNLTEDISNCSEHSALTNLDPRSPTTEFHRTPIIIDGGLKLLSLNNKNLDKARLPLVAITPAKPKKIADRVVKKIYGTPEINSTKLASPKLLESSPITVKPAENKRNSVVGLLETNIDFVETDLDVVIQNKFLKKLELSSDPNTILSDVETSKSSAFSSEDVLKESSLNSTHELNDSDVESDCGIINNVEAISLTTDPEKQFEIKTDKLTEIIQEANKMPAAVDVKNVFSVNELDRKLTNLIYEDKQSEVSPKPSKIIGGNHTPLRDRNVNSQQQKSIPTLKVSDRPSKRSEGISKIPVFKEKRVKGMVNVQCENTPPRMKPKRSQWGAEDSIII